MQLWLLPIRLGGTLLRASARVVDGLNSNVADMVQQRTGEMRAAAAKGGEAAKRAAAGAEEQLGELDAAGDTAVNPAALVS